MITPDELQIAWIAYLKSIPATISPVPVVEVRESNWKGDIFTYPNIRVQIQDVIPDTSPQCSRITGNVIIQVFSEQKSSKEAQTIAGNIAKFIHGKSFTTSGVKFHGIIVERITGVLPVDETMLTWRSEIHLRTLAN